MKMKLMASSMLAAGVLLLAGCGNQANGDKSDTGSKTTVAKKTSSSKKSKASKAASASKKAVAKQKAKQESKKKAATESSKKAAASSSSSAAAKAQESSQAAAKSAASSATGSSVATATSGTATGATSQGSSNNNGGGSTAAPAQTGIAGYIAQSPTARYTNQIVATVASGSYATVYLFEKSGSTWNQVLSTSGMVGSQGVGTASESSSRTPIGSYPLTMAFGTGANPGAGLPYRQITQNSYYISNTSDPQYNTWQERSSSSSADEHMIDYPAQYQYGIVMGYNHGVGGGSAFFLHCEAGGATAGCVSVPTGTMLTLIRRIHSGAHIINVNSASQLAQY